MVLSETNKIGALNDLIAIIGMGTSKYKDIVAKLRQIKEIRPEYLLNKLVEMNIIRKVTPINDKNNPQKMFYSFEDNLIHFYYNYLFVNAYFANRINPKLFYEGFIKNDFETQFISKKFE